MSLTKCPDCGDQHACHDKVDSHAATKATENILFYIGWRAGRLTERMPMTVRPADIQVPARDIIDLITGGKTIEEILGAAEDEL
jgi:hypothetical protein